MKFDEYMNSPCILRTKAALELLTEGVYEIRAPKTRRQGTIAGYFNDASLCAAHVNKINETVPGVYVTLNPVNPALLNRRANSLESFATTTTTDAEIIRRRWLPLDFDPRRPAGISSTDAEHEAALKRAADVRDWLAELGWPEPLYADSGNGAHLLYRIDLPNDAPTGRLIAETIRAIATTWTDEVVVVDESVHNASRIWKLYGTVSAKGDSTKERPWRVSQILKVPSGTLSLVSVEQLEALAAPSRTDTNDAILTTGGRILDVGAYAIDVGLKIQAGPFPLFGRGQKWILEECPFNPDHKKPIVGIVDGKPIFRCLHQSCAGHGWRAFREKVDPGYASPELIAQKMLAGDPLDEKWIEPLGRLSERAYAVAREILKSAKVKNLGVLDKRVRLERQRQIEESAASAGVPGNLYGLIVQIMQMQNEGLVPDFWDNALDSCRYSGPIDDMTLFKASRDIINILVEFHKRGLKWVSASKIEEAIHYITAQRGPRNPMTESLDRLAWDGVPRLASWLATYMAAEDNEYSAHVGRKWMISAVARAYRPGCQADYMLILEGDQGIGKSQALRVIAGNLFYAEFGGTLTTNSDHARFVATTVGKMIVELSELSAFKKSSIETLKHMITSTVDRVRLAYRPDAEDFKRTCVFVGTTNEIDMQYIHDATGARRFWPVRCLGRVDVDGLIDARDQLWAEAVAAFKSGEDWWSVPEELTKIEQAERQVQVSEDTWYQTILRRLEDMESWVGGEVVVHMSKPPTCRIILDEAQMLEMWLEVPVERQTTVVQNKLRVVLTHLGFRSKIIDERGSRKRRKVLDIAKAPKDVFDALMPMIAKAASGDQFEQPPVPPGHSLQ